MPKFIQDTLKFTPLTEAIQSESGSYFVKVRANYEKRQYTFKMFTSNPQQQITLQDVLNHLYNSYFRFDFFNQRLYELNWSYEDFMQSCGMPESTFTAHFAAMKKEREQVERLFNKDIDTFLHFMSSLDAPNPHNFQHT